MNLDNLLKVSNVRCVKTKVHEDLVEGEIYKVEGFNDEAIKIVDCNGFSSWHNKNLFGPVLNNDVSKSDNEIDISLNSVNNVNTTFKVGDKVYKYGETDVKTVLEVFEDGYMMISNYPHRVNHESICYATQENYEMLCKPYPHIKFEQPPKEKTLAEKRYDVIKKLYDSGDIVVIRFGYYESDMIMMGILEGLDSLEHPYPYTIVKNWKFAYAVDRKGIEITEDVLNETIWSDNYRNTHQKIIIDAETVE